MRLERHWSCELSNFGIDNTNYYLPGCLLWLTSTLSVVREVKAEGVLMVL